MTYSLRRYVKIAAILATGSTIVLSSVTSRLGSFAELVEVPVTWRGLLRSLSIAPSLITYMCTYMAGIVLYAEDSTAAKLVLLVV